MRVNQSILAFGLWGIGTSVALAGLAMPARLLAATWVVTSYGDDPADTATIRGALQAAQDGDTIDLTVLTGAIVLTHGGQVQVLNMLGVNASVSIVGPGPDKLAIDGNGISPVFEVFTGITATISGVTIRNGVGLSGTIEGQSGEQVNVALGGGVRNSGTLTLADCTVSGNTAYGGGGGILNLPGKTLAIQNCTLTNNVAYSVSGFGSRGGAIWNSPRELGVPDVAGTLTISDSTIASNDAGTKGGGIQSDNGALTVSDTTLSGNTAGLSGSAISLDDGSASLTNVTVLGNSVTGTSGGGGVAALDTGDSEATVTSSTFSGNVSDAITNDGTLTITNSTIWGSAGNGITSRGQTSLINSTIAGNQGLGVGSGAAAAYLKSTILARNQAGNCEASIPASIISQDHNISDDTTCAIFLIRDNDFAPHTDPGLDTALKDNGGPTQTVALLPGSVAVDAIQPADCAVEADQRGISRPQGKGCDIGAYEATPHFYITPVSALQLSTDGSLTSGVRVNSFVGFSEPVTLLASGVPAGVSVSFNPNPVTPPSYGSVTSTLTINLSPALTPGSYSFTLASSSGILSRSNSVNVQVAATTASITQVVNAELGAACIDSAGVANAITNKLAQAQADINAGDITDARSVLNGLVGLLQAQFGKHIRTACTIGGVTFNADAVLVTDVQALLMSL